MPKARRAERTERTEPLPVAQDLIEGLPIPVFFKGRDGKYLGVNRAWEEFFGIPRGDFLGREVRDLFPQAPWVAEKHLAMDEELWRKPGSQSYEIPVSTRLHGVRDTIYYKATFHRPDGTVGGLIGTIIDITERKHAEAALRESEERFRGTFELAASGIAHVNHKTGRFLHVNKSLSHILGYAGHELLAKSVKDISHPDDRDLTDTQRMKVLSGELPAVRFEKRYIRKDGSVVWVNLAIALARGDDGQPQYEIAVFDDISERKAAEEALHAAHAELKRSNAELEQFAYVASHDLQEPLRMISSYTQLLGRRYGDRLEGDAKDFMGFIVDGAARMKQLIEDLLAYSRVGTRGKEFRPMESADAVRKALINLRASIEEAGAKVTYANLPPIEADELQMVQLFQNLVGNALKFRTQDAPQVSISAVSRENETEFAVKDNGIGIDPQYFERIFMVFQRLHSKGEYPGTGIGLAICKKVVDRHGGRIWVESATGAGSTFHFTLPRERAHNHGH